ncbi:unnamed protein product, partial [marine sediment metagenome]
MLSEKMNAERNDNYEVAKVQEKNRKDLESYRELSEVKFGSLMPFVSVVSSFTKVLILS